MGVYSDGSKYGVPKDLIYSFPVKTSNGSYKIIEGLKVDDFSKKKMQETANELLEERGQALSL